MKDITNYTELTWKNLARVLFHPTGFLDLRNAQMGECGDSLRSATMLSGMVIDGLKYLAYIGYLAEAYKLLK